MKRIELGVFIPIANNGWIVSRTAPQYLPSYDLNRRISQLAEEIGFDFALLILDRHHSGGRGVVQRPAAEAHLVFGDDRLLFDQRLAGFGFGGLGLRGRR